MKALGKISRLAAKQEPLAVAVTVMAVQAKVEKLTSLTVKWTRGSKQRCETNIQKLNSYSNIVNYNETFTRDCQFYQAGNGYQPKMCNFEIREWGTDGKALTIASTEFDMAPYVNKLDEKVKIKFPASLFPQTELLISISISDPEKLRQAQLAAAEKQTQRRKSESKAKKELLEKLQAELDQLNLET